MKWVYLHLRAVEGKGHSPGVDLEMDDAERERLRADHALYESRRPGERGTPDRSYTCNSVKLHLDEIQDLIEAEAFPPGRTPLE